MTAPMDRVASPCVSVCRMDARSGWCEGCLRSIDEIAGWAAMSEEGRREVWRRLAARRESLVQARGTTEVPR